MAIDEGPGVAAETVGASGDDLPTGFATKRRFQQIPDDPGSRLRPRFVFALGQLVPSGPDEGRQHRTGPTVHIDPSSGRRLEGVRIAGEPRPGW